MTVLVALNAAWKAALEAKMVWLHKKDASLLAFTELFRGAKLVNLTNSSVAMTIPLESLDAQLSLCEDALTPLEGNLGNKDRGRIGPDSWRQSGMT